MHAAGSRALVLGRYEIERRLASGGMGELFLANDRSPAAGGRRVVVKQLKEELRSRPNVVRQFVAEATIARRMKHPHIAEVLDCGSFGGLLMMVLEYLEGVTLAQVIGRAVKHNDKRRGLLPVAACQVVRQIALALDYAHHLESAGGKPLGIIHRDVNPGNIMITADGSAKLIDFGIAKAGDTGPQTSADVVKGTLGYLAPEQVTAEAPPDARTDQFQLGVVFWETLCGRYLYPAKSPFEQLQKISAGVMRAPSTVIDLPPALDAIVMRMLARDPDKRFDRLADVAAALDQLARDEGWTPDAAATELHRYAGREPSAAAEDSEAASPEALRCVACGAPVSREANECDVCGIELRTAFNLLGSHRPKSSGEHNVSTEMLVAPFVGRGYPLAVAGSTIREAAIGLIRTTAFLGDFGSGRTTLLLRASELARAAGLRSCLVVGRDLPSFEPYDLARQVLEATGDGRKLTEALSLASIPDRQRRILDAALHGAPSPLLHRDEEQRTRDAAVRDLLLDTAARLGGLVILVDDAEWLDRASQRVLRQLAETPTASDTPLAVLICAHSSFETGEANVVDLLPLTGEESALLAHLSVDEHLLTGADIEQLRRRAGGNAAALVHLLGDLVQPPSASTDLGHDGLLEEDELTGIDAASNHIFRLSPQAQAVLKWAATIGTVFDEGLLQGVVGDAYDTRAALEEARVARIITRYRPGDEGSRLQLFSRSSYRRALRALTSAQEQRWIAQRLARALAASDDKRDQLRSSALVCTIAGSKQRHRAALTVARAVRSASGDEEAVPWFADALAALTRQELQLDPERAAELDGILLEVQTLRPTALIALAEPIKQALKRLEGQLQNGREVQLLCALTRAGDLDAHAALAVAGVGEATMPDRVRIELALVRLEVATRYDGPLPPNFDNVLNDVTDALRRQALGGAWLQWRHLGRTANAAQPPRMALVDEAFTQALAAAERSGSGPGLFVCGVDRVQFELSRGGFQSALELAGRLVDAAQEAGDRAAEIDARLLRASARLGLGDRGRGRYDLEVAGQLAIQLHWRERASETRAGLAALPETLDLDQVPPFMAT
jgi:tRNA A-37 threonylcarbamoyl transferase component Bud32